MRYNTCTNCAVDTATCPRRQQIREAIKGLGIQSVKFKCPERKPMFRPGQRVSFKWSLWVQVDNEYGEAAEIALIFTGTVVRENKTKFIVQVDAGQDASGQEIEASEAFKNESLMTKVRPADMSALQEPDKRVCQTCFWVEGVAEQRCEANEWFQNPIGCLHP